nr:hypothetical protein [Candidatus Sigynarchaeota archaeon]
VDSDGVSWTKFDVVHHGHSEWMKLNPGREETESPYYKQDAQSLDASVRVRMQATIQAYIDHSISSTVNLPNDCSRDTMSKVYMEAWKQGCKGITIFRDGCKKGVIEAETKEKPEKQEKAKPVIAIEESFAPKRPEMLECDIHFSSVNKDSWIFFVGKMNGVPYEIFGGKKCNIEIAKKYRTGWIIKNGRKGGKRAYDLILGSLTDENERIAIRDIASEFSPDAGSYTRMISLSLRHGIPLHIICKQMKKDDKGCNMFSFERAVCRILSKYIKDGSSTGEKCECGSTFVYHDGCMHCLQCGNSRCG